MEHVVVASRRPGSGTDETAALMAHWSIPEEAPTPDRIVRGTELVARYVSFDDRARADRDAAIRAIFPDAPTFSYREADTAFASRHQGPFDVMLIGGTDLVRVAAALRRNALLLRQCARIAVSHDCQPRKVARTLNAGFDDVIDLAVASPEEIVARTRAIVARYRATAPRTRHGQVSAVAERALLSDREVELIAMLAERMGAAIPYQALQDRIADRVEALSIEHLRVLVSKLRSKLNTGFAIVPEKGVGYRLTGSGEGQPAA